MSLKDLDNIIDSGGKLTPMMDQYYQIKKNYPNTLLLFRMGDFYEVFFEDARTASKFLSITLTHRGKIGDTPIPMAGIPHHAANAYIDRLTNRGLKVAICEQVQDPKDAQGIVKRAVTQVVSPGMPYDLEKTSGNEQRYMLSAFKNETSYFISAIDFTTGEFKGFKLKSFEEFLEIIRLLSPKEFITYMGQWNDKNINYQIDNILNHFDVLKTHLSEEYFDSKFTEFYIEKLIPSFKRDKILKKDPAILNAVGALAYYISSTQLIEQFIHVKPFQLTANDGLMKVTHPTLTGLEILPKNRETYNESLLGFFDKTETAMGSRKLKNIFSTPLLDPTRIDERLNIVESFIQESHLIDDCKVELSKIRDIDRILAKISMNKGSASDLLNISNAIFSFENINNLTKNLKIKNEVKVSDFNELKKIAIEIINTINDEIGAGLDKGNLIKDGVNSERDRLKNLHVNVGDALIEMENKLKVETGILKLRIKSNNVSGFFIEVSKGSTTKVPDYFDRRQTLVNAERYTTPSLLQLEKETITAQDKLEKLEREIFKSLINQIGINSNIIQIMGEMIAQIDVFQSFATISIRENLVRPTFTSGKKNLKIEQGFHPLIKSVIKDQFVCHDLNLDENVYFGLITGPNMAGKTTVMREVAIIQLLAQIGSFVPAKKANLTIVDFLFSRLGASDDILKGQSTFMVEMSETAEIIRHATDRSLIILDEVGRGTSTYDGLSIAWGLVEHFINETKALTLFATHYHELIEVIDESPNAKNLTVETINHKGNVQFLYRLIECAASQSYGIYVAKLAGIPRSILKRSEEILSDLENQHGHQTKNETKNQKDKNGKIVHGNQLCFLDEIKEVEIPEYLKEIEDEITKIDISRITPIDALLKLNQLKKQIELN